MRFRLWQPTPIVTKATMGKEVLHVHGGIMGRKGKADKKLMGEADAACVYANASTRFTDGRQFGLGAEIGISTQKFHARGPMALKELTSYKWIIFGTGQVRA